MRPGAKTHRQQDSLRPDQVVAANLVPGGSRVLDLGCGDGLLLERLIRERGCRGTGVEDRYDRFLSTLRLGVPVLSLSLDSDLDQFADRSYDVVLLSQTLQVTHAPLTVLRHVARIGRSAVLSVPNFGLWRHRWSLLRTGRMPVSEDLPFPWYQTPNIHLSTLRDLEELMAEAGLEVEHRVALDSRHHTMPRQRWVNLRASGAVYRVFPA